MKRRTFIRNSVFTAASGCLFRNGGHLPSLRQRTKVRLLRHATLIVEINGLKIMTDPMLSRKGAMDPVANTSDNTRIPMVDLTVSEAELDMIIGSVDAILITHTHRDHWDLAAQQIIPRDKPLFCQPADEDRIKSEGFTQVQAIRDPLHWKGITFHRTNGQHGTGEVGKRMGAVSGFVLEHGHDRLYIAGDTIWCSDVREAITTYDPTFIIVNGGGARFLEGDPITMTVDDVLAVAGVTRAPVAVVHLETINHCFQRRPDFSNAIRKAQLENRIQVPEDGSWLDL